MNSDEQGHHELSGKSDENKSFKPNQIAPSIYIMVELCFFSLDQWEIKIHLLWGKCFNIPHWPRSQSTNGRLQHIEELSKSKTRVGMVWLKWLFLGTIDGVLNKPTHWRGYSTRYSRTQKYWMMLAPPSLLFATSLTIDHLVHNWPLVHHLLAILSTTYWPSWPHSPYRRQCHLLWACAIVYW